MPYCIRFTCTTLCTLTYVAHATQSNLPACIATNHDGEPTEWLHKRGSSMKVSLYTTEVPHPCKQLLTLGRGGSFTRWAPYPSQASAKSSWPLCTSLYSGVMLPSGCSQPGSMGDCAECTVGSIDGFSYV